MMHVLVSLVAASVLLAAVPVTLFALATRSMRRSYRRALKDSHYGR